MAAIVEVIVGIIFLYILLSILVTEVNSVISRAARLRARNLRNTLNDVIADPVLQAKVYSHPLIQLVKAEPVIPLQRISQTEAAKIVRGPIGRVDWIEPDTFVDVVLSTLKADSDQRVFGALINIIDGMPAGPERRGLRALVNRVLTSGEGLEDIRQSLRYVQDRRYRSAIADALNQIDEEMSQIGMRPTDNFAMMASVGSVESPYLRHTLSAVVANASSVEHTRANLETWFARAMSRASSSYAAKMKNLSFAVALVIAVAVNVDTLHIARTLWEDPVRRAQISAEASYTIQSGQLDQQAGGAGNEDDVFRANQTQTESGIEDVIGTGAELANQVQELQDLRLPIGWTFENYSTLEPGHPLRSSPTNLWNYLPDNNPDGWTGLLLAKILGIAATVIAGAQGAPFWFGIVNRILSR